MAASSKDAIRTEAQWGEDEEQGESQLADEETYLLLGNQRRLLAIELLAEKGETVRETDLATQVACLELGQPPEEVEGTQERKRVYVSLHQAHLPKLADYGVINYDTEEGTITPTPLLDEVANQHHWGSPSGLTGAIYRCIQRLLAS